MFQKNLDVWKKETILKKYIAREPEVDAVHTSNKDDATMEVAGVIYQDTDPELGKYQTQRAIIRKKGSKTSNNVRIYLCFLIVSTFLN